LIARYFGGFGDPYDIPFDMFLLLLDRISYVRRIESDAPMSDREYVEFSAEYETMEE
jgi:hypothetical protein